MSNDELNRLAKEAYLRFYARPGFLLRSLLCVRDRRELKRKVRAFLAMVFSQRGTARADGKFLAYQENPAPLVRNYQRRLEGLLSDAGSDTESTADPAGRRSAAGVRAKAGPTTTRTK